MNEIKIDGKICSQRAFNTQSGKTITSFSLNIYNGKKDGQSTYDFIDCKYFGSLDIADKTKVVVSGWIGVESWEKDGHTNKRIVVYAKEVNIDNSTNANNVDVFPEKDVEPLDDDIPF